MCVLGRLRIMAACRMRSRDLARVPPSLGALPPVPCNSSTTQTRSSGLQLFGLSTHFEQPAVVFTIAKQLPA